MSREIKFRVWNKDLKKMSFDCGYNKYHDKNKFIFQRYTGLKDKNKKEIYEDDIVTSEDYYPGVIIYGDDNNSYSGCWLVKTKTGEMLLNDYRDECGEYMEVIGNIHENP